VTSITSAAVVVIPSDAVKVAPCTMRYIPAKRLNELVRTDLCQVLLDPSQIALALERAQNGVSLSLELQARQTTRASSTVRAWNANRSGWWLPI
jgi:hypothetical protein